MRFNSFTSVPYISTFSSSVVCSASSISDYCSIVIVPAEILVGDVYNMFDESGLTVDLQSSSLLVGVWK